MKPVSPEVYWLAATCLLTGLMWIPYVANRFRELGAPGWHWFPEADPPQRAPWAARLARAHVNALENLAIFAPLALAIELAEIADSTTGLACQVFFWARLAYAGICSAGFPIVVRTAAFLIGVGVYVVLAGRLLGLIP